MKKIFFVTFLSLWVILILLNFIIPNKSFSEQENRYLSTFPKFNIKKLVNGEYTKDLNDYINDNFIFRNFFLKLNSTFNLSLGKTENNDVIIGKDGFLFEKFKYQEEEKDNLKKVINVVNNFSENIDVPIYFMLIPNSIYINKEKLPIRVNIYDQSGIIEEFYSKLNSKIKQVDVIDTLIKNKNNYLYFKTDHHLTSNGAYFSYIDFCKISNITPPKLQDFTKEIVSKDFLGTFDSKAQVLNQKEDEIVVYKNNINMNVSGNYDGNTYNSIFNEEYLKKKDKYSYFLNGNNAKVIIKTNLNNRKKILVIKDSYAHIFAQFFCQNYKEIHFIDPRYYKLSILDYIKENDITDIVFLYNVSNIVTDVNIRTIK